ncbi:protein FAM187B-like [Moschus berezovskii]|uniref:protein FAM187B-like n=1 Tax=Moschus berezovskii TaxID=68408 RepID=UPI00244382A2|nr:protein FAM187B-like [Moschus berezovskii]
MKSTRPACREKLACPTLALRATPPPRGSREWIGPGGWNQVTSPPGGRLKTRDRSPALSCFGHAEQSVNHENRDSTALIHLLREAGRAAHLCPLFPHPSPRLAMDPPRPVFWEANDLSLTWKDQLSSKSISTIMDTSNGGSWLQVFQPAIYRCFVHQELMAQFNSKVSVDPLKFLSPEKSKQQAEAEATRKEKANSVLEGLSMMILVGMVLAVLGCLLKQFHFSQSRRINKMLLVK